MKKNQTTEIIYNKLIHQKKTATVSRGRKKGRKKITRSGRGEGVQFALLLLVLLVQVARRREGGKRKENTGKRHEAFLSKIKKVINQRKWKKIINFRKDLQFSIKKTNLYGSCQMTWQKMPIHILISRCRNEI